MAKRRRDESPERQALREAVSGYLKENPVKNGTDANALMRRCTYGRYCTKRIRLIRWQVGRKIS